MYNKRLSRISQRKIVVGNNKTFPEEETRWAKDCGHFKKVLNVIYFPQTFDEYQQKRTYQFHNITNVI